MRFSQSPQRESEFFLNVHVTANFRDYIQEMLDISAYMLICVCDCDCESLSMQTKSIYLVCTAESEIFLDVQVITNFRNCVQEMLDIYVYILI